MAAKKKRTWHDPENEELLAAMKEHGVTLESLKSSVGHSRRTVFTCRGGGRRRTTGQLFISLLVFFVLPLPLPLRTLPSLNQILCFVKNVPSPLSNIRIATIGQLKLSYCIFGRGYIFNVLDTKDRHRSLYRLQFPQMLIAHPDSGRCEHVRAV